MKLKSLLYSIFWLLLIGISLFVFYEFKQSPVAQWETFEKQELELESHPTTKEELKEARVNTQTRKIASLKQRQVPRYSGRQIVNRHKEIVEWDEIEFSNEVNSNWKKRLAARLLRMQSNGTKLLIKHKDKAIRIYKGQAYYTELVVVTYVGNNGSRNGYTAYVDSESGKVLRSWDRTRYENLPGRKLIE